MMPNYELLLDGVIHLAQAASQAIMAIYATDFAVQEKADRSPLTLADQAAHDLIIAGLRELTPDWPSFSEESEAVPYAVRASWPYYWLIDPLDGTKEFIRRNGEFTVNIALIHEHRPVLGVVVVPVTGVVYFAAEKVCAYKRMPGELPKPIHVRPCPDSALRLVGSRSHADPGLQKLLDCLGPGTTLTQAGSSLKICLVAEGQADLYPRLGPTSEWDTAAAQCIVEQAGGHLSTLNLLPLRYNTQDSLLNPHFVVFGNTHPVWLHCLERIKSAV